MRAKKFISSVLALCCILTVWTVGVYAQPESTAEMNSILVALSEFKIMTGDPDGSFRLDDTVTRAEFTKVAVAASKYKDSVATNLMISPFMDVPYTHWGAPYVKVGVKNGLITGYPDGSFDPDGAVAYEEAVTMLLRVLGYSEDDFGVSWPYGQLGLAGNLDMTKNLSLNAGDRMTRRDVAQLVYNTLDVKQKESGQKLVSIFDATLIEDVTIYSSSTEDSSLASDEIYTSSGTYKINDTFNRAFVGAKGELTVKDENKVVAFVPVEEVGTFEKYVIYSTLANTVVSYKDGNMTQLDIKDSTTVYKDKAKTTYAAVKQQLEMGDVLYIKKNGMDIEYISYDKETIVGPLTVVSSDWTNAVEINDNTTITRNGTKVDINAIQTYDIIYFSKNLNMVLAYHNKITGIYEKATPNKDIPDTVTVSGVDYKIESSAAFNKLSSSGEFSYGDTVTLLMGKDNEIADVQTASSQTTDTVGYLIGAGTKEFTTSDTGKYTGNYVKVVLTSGESYEYIADKNYEDYLNAIVKVSFHDGIAKLSIERGQTTYSGKYVHSAKKLGDTSVSSNVEILDVGTQDRYRTGIYATVFPKRLDGVTISAKNILYAEKNGQDELVKLILNDVTGDAYQYGIVTSAQITNIKVPADKKVLPPVGGSYEYIVGGQSYSYTLSGSSFMVSTGDAMKIAPNGQKPELMQSLTEISGQPVVTSTSTLVADKETYQISDKVSVYRQTSSYTTAYTLMPISDIVNNENYTLYAYYDKTAEAGGRVRVIVAVDKK